MELATALEELRKAKAMIEIVTRDRNRRAEMYDVSNIENTRLQRALDAAQEQILSLGIKLDTSNGIRNGMSETIATLQAQLADRDAMILQMGEQAAVLAKENMAVKAQLRQAEGDRDCCEKPHDCKWGGLGGCGYEGRNNERANAAQIEGGA